MIVENTLTIISDILKKTISGAKKQEDGTFRITKKSMKSFQLAPKELTLLMTKQPSAYLADIFAPLNKAYQKASKDMKLPEKREMQSLLRYALGKVELYKADYSKEAHLVMPDIESGIPWTTISKIINEECLKTKRSEPEPQQEKQSSKQNEKQQEKNPEWEIKLNQDQMKDLQLTQKIIDEQLKKLEEEKRQKEEEQKERLLW